MTYTLGVDLGTTFTAAAVDDGSGPVPLKLGSSAEAMPSVVAIRDGEPVTGEAAEEVLRTTPAAGVREAKRRLGDSTPFILDGAPYGAEALMGLLLADVIKVATEQRGEAPASVVLSHPANWGDFKKDLLSDTARVAGLEDVGLITEPQAAAIHYVRSGELEVGQAAAVYDFGGGTFDAAVVRCAEAGPELVGEAKGLERLGGIDLDQAILMHVNDAVDGALRELDASDPVAAAAMAAVRAQCVAAKEALSTSAEASVSVALPGLNTEVRLTRPEFEQMLRPRIADTLTQLDAALASAGLKAGDLSAVVLVGGTSRIPLVSEMVGAHTGVRVVASADHKTVVCVGAAAGDAPAAAAADVAEDGAAAPGAAFVVTGPKPVGDAGDPTTYRGGVKKRRLVMLGGAAVLATGAVLASATAAGATPADAMNLLGLGDDDGAGADGGDGGMIAAKLDEFEEVAPPPAPDGDGGPAGAGGAPHGGGAPHAMGGGGSPIHRAAAMHRGGGGAPHRAPQHDDDGPGGLTRPGGAPGAPPGAASSDPEFMHTKSELLASIQKWQPPAGVDPKVAADFRAELLDRIQRFQAMPGESAEHALAAMKDEYQDQVKDFVQDQRIKDLIDEDKADDAQAAAIDARLDDAKAKLLAGLSQYKPPAGTDPEDYASMRADVEALIQRYHAIPGQSAEEALAELRYQYESRVRDMAQDMKIDRVAEDLTKEDTAANATTTVTEGSTTITYGPAYYDRATNPPRPNITENDDGTRTVTFVNEQGRQVTIKTTEPPEAAIEKYRDHIPPPPETPEHSPENTGFFGHFFDRDKLIKLAQNAAEVDETPTAVDLAHRFLGFPRLEDIRQATVAPTASIDPDQPLIKVAPAPMNPDGPDPRVTMPVGVATAVASDAVVGDDDTDDAWKPADEPTNTGIVPPHLRGGAGSDDDRDEKRDRDDDEKDDEFAAVKRHGHDEFGSAHEDDKAFAMADDDDPFAIKPDESADEFDSHGASSGDDDMDPMLS